MADAENKENKENKENIDKQYQAWQALHEKENPTVTDYMKDRASYKELYQYAKIFEYVKSSNKVSNPIDVNINDYILDNADRLGLPKSLRDKTKLKAAYAWASAYSSTKGQIGTSRDILNAHQAYSVKNLKDKNDADKAVKDNEKAKEENKKKLKKARRKSRNNWWGMALGHVLRAALIFVTVSMVGAIAIGAGPFALASSVAAGLGISAASITATVIGSRALGKFIKNRKESRNNAKADIKELKKAKEELKEKNEKDLKTQAKLETKLAEDAIIENFDEGLAEEVLNYESQVAVQRTAESAAQNIVSQQTQSQTSQGTSEQQATARNVAENNQGQAEEIPVTSTQENNVEDERSIHMPRRTLEDDDLKVIQQNVNNSLDKLNKQINNLEKSEEIVSEDENNDETLVEEDHNTRHKNNSESYSTREKVQEEYEKLMGEEYSSMSSEELEDFLKRITNCYNDGFNRNYLTDEQSKTIANLGRTVHQKIYEKNESTQLDSREEKSDINLSDKKEELNKENEGTSQNNELKPISIDNVELIFSEYLDDYVKEFYSSKESAFGDITYEGYSDFIKSKGYVLPDKDSEHEDKSLKEMIDAKLEEKIDKQKESSDLFTRIRLIKDEKELNNAKQKFLIGLNTASISKNSENIKYYQEGLDLLNQKLDIMRDEKKKDNIKTEEIKDSDPLEMIGSMENVINKINGKDIGEENFENVCKALKGIEEKYKDKLDAKLLTKVKNLKSKVASYGKEKGYISEEDAKKFVGEETTSEGTPKEELKTREELEKAADPKIVKETVVDETVDDGPVVRPITKEDIESIDTHEYKVERYTEVYDAKKALDGKKIVWDGKYNKKKGAKFKLVDNADEKQ